MPVTTIVSPHPDDAVLSLWQLLTGPGHVRVLNVFAGSPNDGCALGLWDRITRAEDPVTRAAERRAEDEHALALAGRTALSLDFLDDQYCEGEQPLKPLVEAIAAASRDTALLLAPAALDGHPDHRRARAAALALQDRGLRVALYADVPHATTFGWPAWVSGATEEPYLEPGECWEHAMKGTGISLRVLDPRVIRLDADQCARKRDAVDCYRTQVPALEISYSILSRPEVLSYEVIWPLPPSNDGGEHRGG
jgi:LmbE family N-acetylglucosaminyl deacetylase